MAAGATDAVLTAIIMITGMSGDTGIALPLLLAASAAWWTRRALMAESIYTVKLLARGHAVPEGLQAPVLPMRRVADAMAEPVGFEIHDGEHGGIGAVRAADGRLLRHVTASPEDGLLAAATRLHDVGAEVILVLRDEAAVPDAVVGVVTQRALVGQLRAELERQG